MRELKGKNVAVLGYGLEGEDLVSYLLGEGAVIAIFDKKEEKGLDLTQKVKKKTRLFLGGNYLSGGLKDFDVVFRSPGVYRYLPEIVAAEEKGIEIYSAIKLFFDLCPAKIIGVTGTKGKGTTSTLIYNILKQSGKEVYLAGNIGKAYLTLLNKLKRASWVVLELSSAQLIDLHKSPHIAVVLNITSDHLDWHKDRKEYVDAKKNIVSHQKKSDFAVINFDYETPRDFSKDSKAEVLYFSKSRKVRGAHVRRGNIILSTENDEVIVGKTENLLLRGKHNWENVTAAICAAKLAGASTESINSTVFSFKGLEHRLELVGEVGGIKFYNDSFATGPQPTIAAIKSFKEPTTVILGGFDKGLDYSDLGEEIARKDNVNTIVLIGDVTAKVETALNGCGYKGKILKLGKPKMDKIVQAAYTNTPKNGVVLLSPAAASFDMFENYKERGNQFRKAVKKIKK